MMPAPQSPAPARYIPPRFPNTWPPELQRAIEALPETPRWKLVLRKIAAILRRLS
jgi:hypothetical protein